MTLRLRELRLGNYRGFQSAAVSLEDLTVLVGPNGSGKSTVLDALDFLRESITDSLPVALDRRGGLRDVLHRPRQGSVADAVRLAVTFEFDLQQLAVRPDSLVREALARRAVDVEFTNVTTGDRDDDSRVRCRGLFGVELATGDDRAENRVALEICWNDSPIHRTYRRDRDAFTSTRPGVAPVLDAQRLLLPVLAGQDGAWQLTHAVLARLRAYRPHPSSIQDGGPVGAGDALEADGRNVGDVLRALETAGDREALDWIQRHLAAIVPGIDAVVPVAQAGRRSLMFEQRGEGDAPRQLPVGAMSQGTLRALAILAALRQPRRPSCIGVDELEDSIHPSALAVLVDAIAATAVGSPPEVPPRNQVLFTTHSPEVLTHPAITPDRLRLVEHRDGRSAIYRLAPGMAPLLSAPGALGRLMRSNGLHPADEPDVAPEDFFAPPAP